VESKAYWRGVILVAVLSLTLAGIANEVTLHANNTLMAHAQWVSAKQLLSSRLMGAWHAPRTRNLLHKNHLQLQEWHGFNEVLLAKPISLGSVRFRFSLQDTSYLNVIVNKDSEGYSGFRLSRSPVFESQFFRAETGGRFTETRPFTEKVSFDSWHDAEVTFADSNLKLLVDGKLVQQVEEAAKPSALVGFRGGLKGARVDDVVVLDGEGQTIIVERFRNVDRYWARFALWWAGVLGVMFVVVLGARARRVARPRTLLRILAALFCLNVLLGSCFAFDYLYWSKSYCYKGIKTPWGRGLYRGDLIEQARTALFLPFRSGRVEADSSASLKQARAFLNRKTADGEDIQVIRTGADGEVIGWVSDNEEGIETYLADPRVGSSFRILFLGTSQTWGAGAVHSTDRVVTRTSRILAAESKRSSGICSLNASVRGSNSRELLERYRSHLHRFEPQLVVVNLSNNDGNSGFEQRLRVIVELNNELGAETLFVLEPNTSERTEPSLVRNHEVMRQVARDAAIPVADLHTHLLRSDRQDSGFLWWDVVHLSSWGQELSARFIAARILEQPWLHEQADRRRAN
jgi:lysophospholipase L1-like esterase